MTKIKILLLMACSMIVMSTFCIARTSASEMIYNKTPSFSDLTMQIKGYAHFQLGHRPYSDLGKMSRFTAFAREKIALHNDVHLWVEASQKIGTILCGAKVVLVTTPNKDHRGGSHIFIKSNIGTIELGSIPTAGSNMMVDGATIAAATFGGWYQYAEFCHLSKPNFPTIRSTFLSHSRTMAYTKDPAHSISFYTPKFQLGNSTKLQLGVTYIPNSDYTGGHNMYTISEEKRKVIHKTGEVDKFVIHRLVQNTFSNAITIEKHFTNKINFQLSIASENGKVAGLGQKSKQPRVGQKFQQAGVFQQDCNDDDDPHCNDDDPHCNDDPLVYKLNNLRSYHIGALLNLGNISYASSLSSIGKSFTHPKLHKTRCKERYHTSTLAYKTGPLATSISYFKSHRFKNTINAVSIGISYLPFPGFKPYVEISSFILNGRPDFYDIEAPIQKVRGTIVLIGTKLSL